MLAASLLLSALLFGVTQDTGAPAVGAPDPGNPAHCAVAFEMMVIIADNLSPAEALEMRRRSQQAAQQAALRFKPDEAIAARKQVWPFLSDRKGLTQLVSDCRARQDAQ